MRTIKEKVRIAWEQDLEVLVDVDPNHYFRGYVVSYNFGYVYFNSFEPNGIISEERHWE